MSWIINQDKEITKNCLIPGLISSITNVTSASKEDQELIASINFLIGGLPSGTDSRCIGFCQRALGNLSQASGLLRQGLDNAQRLNTMEWISDGD